MTLTIDRTGAPTAALPTVTLPELNRSAALQTRVDRKYLVGVRDLPAVIEALPAGTRVLEIDGLRSFGYLTTYFDTPELRCYRDAAHRRRHRFKVRTRLYTDTSLCRLEVKTRDGRRRTVKSSLDYSSGDRGRLTLDAQALVTSATGSDRWAHLLQPSSITRYRRTTLVLPTEQTRITVDLDLSTSLPDGVPVAAEGVAVVETKGGHAPTAADRSLWRLGHRPARISKYGTGLALLRPDLPANKWHRALQRIHEEMT